MWAVHTGRRPPLLHGCPQIIEDLMIKFVIKFFYKMKLIDCNFFSCWQKDPRQRPSMTLVRGIMEDLLTMFSGFDLPVLYLDEDEEEEEFGVFKLILINF